MLIFADKKLEEKAICLWSHEVKLKLKLIF